MLYRSYCEGVFSTDQTLYAFLCTRTLHSFLGVSEFFIPVAICLLNLSKLEGSGEFNLSDIVLQ